MPDGFGFPEYVPVAERLRRGRAQLARILKREGRSPEPVALSGGRGITRTFWGRSWCENLERYSDFASRLPRGRTYARNGSVLDLVVAPGRVVAHVAGHELYRVEVEIARLAARRWRDVIAACGGRVASVVALLEGSLSDDVLAVLTDAKGGLFPEPDEIALACSCPDVAQLCKHLAAALYAVGARLDERPELFFVLRQVDQHELLAVAPSLRRGVRAQAKTIAAENLSSIFGIEVETRRPKRKKRG
jgi:uncharacterized Zn finger protein